MPSASATQRIQALSSQLSPSPNPNATANTMAAAAPKPPITCHVLDTTIGKPASSIPATLTHHPSSSTTSTPLVFTATTNADGRVTCWTAQSSEPLAAAKTIEQVFHQEGDQKWSLTFDTEAYFGEKGIKTFFPEVEVKFVVRKEQKGEHFHVPVLLGPFGYTTYRGS